MNDSFSNFINQKSIELNKATEKQKEFLYDYLGYVYDESYFDIESLSIDEARNLIRDISLELRFPYEDAFDFYDYQ
ncbi:hypothetical protein VL10_ORF35 [Staphylococcus phage vB_SauM_VL10]|nr:hypothetical protein VL10_ORF35 [Staphylococcus phage vB_SauM_VL10]